MVQPVYFYIRIIFCCSSFFITYPYFSYTACAYMSEHARSNISSFLYSAALVMKCTSSSFLMLPRYCCPVLLKPNNLIYGILLYESDMDFLISRIICIMQRHILEYTIFFDLTFIANSVIVSLPVNVPANLFAMSGLISSYSASLSAKSVLLMLHICLINNIL